MKIISIILIIFGFILCVGSSLGIRFAIYTLVDGLMSSDTAGIGMVASAISSASLLSYVNLFGCAIIFIGILLNIVGMFAGRKRQTV